MQAWGAWFGTLGDAVAEIGNPFAASATVSASGSSDGGTSKASGFSIIVASPSRNTG